MAIISSAELKLTYNTFMVKVVILFGLTLVLVAAGGYVKNNPGIKYRIGSMIPGTVNLRLQPVPRVKVEQTVFEAEANQYSLSIPANWRLEKTIPGCGPVWFAPSNQKIWITFCPPSTSPKLVEGEEKTLGNHQVILSETNFPEGSRIAIQFENGYIGYLYNFGAGGSEFREIFNQVMSSVTFS